MLVAAYLLVGTGLLLAARLLYRAPKNAPQSFAPSTTANRGDFLPLVLGTQRVGCQVGWVGDRKVTEVSAGGKGFGGGGGSSNSYTESAWHLLCIGPARQLLAIYANGKAIWTGPIDASTSPSGTTIEVPDQGSFTIYWGELDQGVDPYLADPARVGIASAYPYTCHVVWRDKTLGSSPNWPQLEYVVRCDCIGSKLADSDYVLDDGTSRGLNPAHALYQLLTAEFPHGAGLDPTMVDATSLEALGELCQDEHLPLNMTIAGGPEFARPLQAILQDLGVMMAQVGGRLVFLPQRPASGAVPTLGDDVVMPPDGKRSYQRGDLAASRIVFTFKDEASNRYKDQPIAFDEDAEAAELRRYDVTNATIAIASHLAVASAIARRRSQEALTRAAVTLKVLRAGRQLVPGQLVQRTGLGLLRVTSIKLDDKSAAADVELTPDLYGVPDIADAQTAPGPGAGAAPLAPLADLAFTWMELPASLTSQPAFVVFRTRGHDQIAGATVYASANGTSYQRLKAQDASAAGGTILTGIAASTDEIIAAGPKFEASNADAASVLDLSGDTAGWQAGRLLALIDSELFYLQSLTLTAHSGWSAEHAYASGDYVVPSGSATGLRYKCTTAGTSGVTQPAWPTSAGATVIDGTAMWTAHQFEYQLNNLIRARDGTAMAIHAIGARVYIIERSKLTVQTSSLIQPGVNLCVKTEPFTASGVVDIATVTAVCQSVQGLTVAGTMRVDGAGNTRITATGETRIVSL